MSNRTILSIFAAASLAIGLTPFAHAADHEFCCDYAESAVSQFRHAERHGRCENHFREERGRWHDNFRAHYEWCRDVCRESAWAERRARSGVLERCAERDRRDDYR